MDDPVRLQQKLAGHCRWKRKLKENAVPTIFAHKPVKKPRLLSKQRAARKQRQEVHIKIFVLLHGLSDFIFILFRIKTSNKNWDITFETIEEVMASVGVEKAVRSLR